MPAPDALPDTARAAAWRALWDHLVLEASQERDPEPAGPDSDDDRPIVEAPIGRTQVPALPRGPPLLNSS